MKRLLNIFLLISTITLWSCQVIDENERYIPVQSGQSGKVVVLVDFSGIGCVNCPTAAETVHELLAAYPDNLIAAEMHPASNSFTKSTSPEFDYTCEAADTYYKYFGGISTTSFPTGVVDFKQQQDGSYFTDYSSWASQIVKCSQQIAKVAVKAEIDLDAASGQDKLQVSLCSSENIHAQVLLWILEDSIVGIQKSTSGNKTDYVRNHLLRGTLTGDWGETKDLAANDTIIDSYAVVLPEVCVRQNCSIAVVVLDADTKEVLNAAKCQMPEQQEPFKLYYGGTEITADTTIVVNEVIKDLFGDYMECVGSISGVGQVSVDIRRSAAGLEDELCINTCAAGNGELTETKTYTIEGTSEWYAHFYPKAAEVSTIEYRFYNSAKSLTLKVQFDATNAL